MILRSCVVLRLWVFWYRNISCILKVFPNELSGYFFESLPSSFQVTKNVFALELDAQAALEELQEVVSSLGVRQELEKRGLLHLLGKIGVDVPETSAVPPFNCFPLGRSVFWVLPKRSLNSSR